MIHFLPLSAKYTVAGYVVRTRLITQIQLFKTQSYLIGGPTVSKITCFKLQYASLWRMQDTGELISIMSPIHSLIEAYDAQLLAEEVRLGVER
jgi:hypothetical protein